MLVNESEIFIEERNEKKVEKSITNSILILKMRNNMRIVLKKLHEKKAKWRPCERIFLTWVFFILMIS
jgi:hypothetical protein